MFLWCDDIFISFYPLSFCNCKWLAFATSIEPGQPAPEVGSSIQSDQALYSWLTVFQVLILMSLKIIMESSKNRIWIIPFIGSGLIITYRNFRIFPFTSTTICNFYRPESDVLTVSSPSEKIVKWMLDPGYVTVCTC